jgi:hypothetical protein
MDALVAIAHIGGAAIAVFVFGIGVAIVSAWELKRNQRVALEEMSLAIGVPIDDLNNSEHTPKVLQFSSDKFSSELPRNRVSDLCGLIRTAWGWLGLLLEVGIFAAVVWYTTTDSFQNAVYAWWIVAVALVVWVVSVVFALLCNFLTGRYPGQARQVRKSLGEFVRNQRLNTLADED